MNTSSSSLEADMFNQHRSNNNSNGNSSNDSNNINGLNNINNINNINSINSINGSSSLNGINALNGLNGLTGLTGLNGSSSTSINPNMNNNTSNTPELLREIMQHLDLLNQRSYAFQNQISSMNQSLLLHGQQLEQMTKVGEKTARDVFAIDRKIQALLRFQLEQSKITILLARNMNNSGENHNNNDDENENENGIDGNSNNPNGNNSNSNNDGLLGGQSIDERIASLIDVKLQTTHEIESKPEHNGPLGTPDFFGLSNLLDGSNDRTNQQHQHQLHQQNHQHQHPDYSGLITYSNNDFSFSSDALKQMNQSSNTSGTNKPSGGPPPGSQSLHSSTEGLLDLLKPTSPVSPPLSATTTATATSEANTKLQNSSAQSNSRKRRFSSKDMSFHSSSSSSSPPAPQSSGSSNAASNNPNSNSQSTVTSNSGTNPSSSSSSSVQSNTSNPPIAKRRGRPPGRLNNSTLMMRRQLQNQSQNQLQQHQAQTHHQAHIQPNQTQQQSHPHSTLHNPHIDLGGLNLSSTSSSASSGVHNIPGLQLSMSNDHNHQVLNNHNHHNPHLNPHNQLQSSLLDSSQSLHSISSLSDHQSLEKSFDKSFEKHQQSQNSDLDNPSESEFYSGNLKQAIQQHPSARYYELKIEEIKTLTSFKDAYLEFVQGIRGNPSIKEQEMYLRNTFGTHYFIQLKQARSFRRRKTLVTFIEKVKEYYNCSIDEACQKLEQFKHDNDKTISWVCNHLPNVEELE